LDELRRIMEWAKTEENALTRSSGFRQDYLDELYKNSPTKEQPKRSMLRSLQSLFYKTSKKSGGNKRFKTRKSRRGSRQKKNKKRKTKRNY